jgi:hypothetical protein
MDEIVSYWAADPLSDTPDLKSYFIGWSEPLCFACGWLPPVSDCQKDSWRRAGRWLDRAHLHDRVFGGDLGAHNLVAMCHQKQVPRIRARRNRLTREPRQHIHPREEDRNMANEPPDQQIGCKTAGLRPNNP